MLDVILDSYSANNVRQRIEMILKSCTHRQQVEFALYCATDLDKYYDVKKYKKVYEARQKCLELVGNWLLNPKSVSNKQLHGAANAVNAAYTAAYAAAYAAYTAANAAANAVNAAANAVNAVNAAYTAAYAAAYAAYTAAYTASYDTEMNRYLHYLIFDIIKIDSYILKLVG